MLFDVVSLKCNRPTVTLVTWELTNSTLKLKKNKIKTIFLIKKKTNLQHWMKWFFAAITLTLLNANSLRGAVMFHPIKVQMKTRNFLKTLRRLHKLRIPQQLHMTSDLKVVLFLAHKRIISIWKIKTLIGINTIVWNGPKKPQLHHKKNTQNRLITALLGFDRTKHASCSVETLENVCTDIAIHLNTFQKRDNHHLLLS